MSKDTPSLSDVLPKEKVAQLLGISLRTLNRWHAEGDGPPLIKVGRKTFYFEKDVLHWLQNRRRAGVRSA